MPDTTDKPLPQPNPRRRWRRRVKLICLLVLLVWFGRFAYLRIALRPTPRPEYWQAKMAALDPPPPTAIQVNETPLLIASPPWASDPAITAIGSLSGSFSRPWNPGTILTGPWEPSRPDIAAVRKVFASPAFKDARREILRVLETGWQQPINMNPTVHIPAPESELCRWLLAHSRWAREETHDPAVAVEDWLAAFRLAHQIRRRDPSIASFEAGMVGVTASEIRHAAREGMVLPDTRGFQARVEQIVGPPRSPQEVLEPEHLGVLCELEYVFVREGGQWMDISEMLHLRWLAYVGMDMRPWRVWNLTSPLFHDLPEATQRVERLWAEYVKCVDLVTCPKISKSLNADRRTAIAPLDGWYEWYYPVGPSETPMPIWHLQSYYRALCSLDAAFTMLALNAYHAEHRRYPDAIAELIPQYLSRQPIDYADRQPLRYRRTDADYVLYSIGPDGKDDGGRFFANKSYDRPYTFSSSSGDVILSAIERGPGPSFSAPQTRPAYGPYGPFRRGMGPMMR